MPLLGTLVVQNVAAAAEPSFDCRKAKGSIEALICGDEELSALDRGMAAAYRAASKKAVNEAPMSPVRARGGN